MGIVYFPFDQNSVMLYFFFFGVGASGQTVGFATIADNCKDSYRAAGLGFNNGMIMVFTAVTAPLIAEVLTCLSGGGEPTLGLFHEAFSLLIALSAVSVVLSLFFIRETFCKKQKDPQPLHY